MGYFGVWERKADGGGWLKGQINAQGEMSYQSCKTYPKKGKGIRQQYRGLYLNKNVKMQRYKENRRQKVNQEVRESEG